MSGLALGGQHKHGWTCYMAEWPTNTLSSLTVNIRKRGPTNMAFSMPMFICPCPHGSFRLHRTPITGDGSKSPCTDISGPYGNTTSTLPTRQSLPLCHVCTQVTVTQGLIRVVQARNTPEDKWDGT